MEQRSRALLIGVGAFESEVVPDLPAVEKDLGSMKAALTNEDGPAFSSTEVVENPAGCDLRRAIEAFFLRAGGDARLNLLYLASHARVDEQGTLQLLPSDFDPSCPLATAVPVTFIGECMQHCGPQATVILLDCCFAEAGMWRLLEHRKDLLQLREHAWPSYCVIAATRSRDTAADGAFARYFVEALDAVDPEPDEESVGAVRIYDYVVTRLRDRHMQVPRLWQSRSFAIPLGRRSAGLRATREAVEEMYAFVTDRKLEALPQPDACGLDFIERRAVGIGNLVTRTGIRILGGTPSLAEVEAAAREGRHSDAAQIASRLLREYIGDKVALEGSAFTAAEAIEILAAKRAAGPRKKGRRGKKKASSK